MTSGMSEPRPRGLRRVITLWRLWRREATEPEPFYRALADETARSLIRRHGPFTDQRIADLGCGPGFYSAAIRDAGATVVPIDADPFEMSSSGTPPKGALLADACRVPVASGSLDGVFCSNLLEHTPDPEGVIDEMVRVLRPGGWGYLSWTNWYSPWGGHEMSPYHFLGPRFGPRLYERRHGAPRKNRLGESLFPVHIGSVLRSLRSHRGLKIERVEPRYWPRLAIVSRVPILREVLSWNCVVHFTKIPDGAHPSDEAELELTLAEIDSVEGWMTRAQARRLWEHARSLDAPATVVEVGSFRGRSTIVLARAVSGHGTVVAIDPHAGTDRGPREWSTSAELGVADHDQFRDNLRRAGVEGHVRHVRRPSQAALENVDGPVDLLFIDGAHRYHPARFDLEQWGRRIRPGGTMLVHDAFSSLGVTAALGRVTLWGRDFRYLGRTGSLAEFRREPVQGMARVRNALAQLRQLPWFARNIIVKVAILARFRGLARLLGHRSGPWPY